MASAATATVKSTAKKQRLGRVRVGAGEVALASVSGASAAAVAAAAAGAAAAADAEPESEAEGQEARQAQDLSGLHIRDREGAIFVRSLVALGRGGNVKGVRCTASMLSEMLLRWTTERTDELLGSADASAAAAKCGSSSSSGSSSGKEGHFSRETRACLEELKSANASALAALEKLPRTALGDSEAALGELLELLNDFRSPTGNLVRSRAEGLSAIQTARARADQLREEREAANEENEEATAAAEEASEKREEIGVRIAELSGGILAIEAKLRELKKQRDEAVADQRSLSDAERGHRVRAQKAAEESARKESASNAFEETARHATSVVEIMDTALCDFGETIDALELAVVERWRGYEKKLKSWTAAEVAAWLRRLPGGHFEAQAAEFERQSVTGQLLQTLTHEELVSLGVKDLASRRSLLEAVARLGTSSSGSSCAVAAAMPDQAAIPASSSSSSSGRRGGRRAAAPPSAAAAAAPAPVDGDDAGAGEGAGCCGCRRGWRRRREATGRSGVSHHAGSPARPSCHFRRRARTGL
eukprot:TRINITY_DN2860_c1_g1_i2.p1 TRINITY_DN2860_c1_g1~~TRINITY_DN2860_c1_g1_i2.p1  ORF type:complete len:611 (-),score=139.96 TRINITY_DN2860_c1_g1_i2:240-1841(-)